VSSTTPAGSDRQLHRNKGLARISALTLGAGAAGLVGAVAIAVTLPGSTVVSALKSTTATTLTSGSTAAANGNSTSSSSGEDGSTSTSPAQAQAQAQAQTQSQLQSGTAPTTTNSPPAATSGAS
jgi:phage-related protein